MALAPADAPETVARVREGMHLVETVARQLQRQLKWGSFDDLCSAGREGLLQAARKFDASLDIPFGRYASIRVRGAMLDAVRAQAGIPRRALERMRAIEAADAFSEGSAEDERQRAPAAPEQADDALSTYLAHMATAMAMGLLAQPAITHLDGDEATVDLVDDHEGPEEAASRNELMIKVHEAIDSQPDAERHLLKRTYIDGVDLTVAAKEIGLSKSWASRIHARGIEAVTKRLKLQRVAP